MHMGGCIFPFLEKKKKREQFPSRGEMSTTNMDLDFHSKMPTKAVVSKVSVNLPGVEKQAGEDHRVRVKFRSEPGCIPRCCHPVSFVSRGYVSTRV